MWSNPVTLFLSLASVLVALLSWGANEAMISTRWRRKRKWRGEKPGTTREAWGPHEGLLIPMHLVSWRGPGMVRCTRREAFTLLQQVVCVPVFVQVHVYVEV